MTSHQEGICSVTVIAFVRIGTSQRAFENPLRIAEAAGYVREWLAAPCASFVSLTEADCLRALTLLEQAGAGENLTTDAQIAACAQRLQATVHTADTDFARFRVQWINPLTESPV
ncbi:MAG: PIN domain-containing protein [Terrimicrobiaceae bacterium]|nr:PIN domain-containing protein [Terrimicrobiaceae bacterium]